MKLRTSARFSQLMVALVAPGLGMAGINLPIKKKASFEAVAVWQGSESCGTEPELIADEALVPSALLQGWFRGSLLESLTLKQPFPPSAEQGLMSTSPDDERGTNLQTMSY